ncbi:MAG TPA: hypothetical protein VK206_22965 [Anaerolineales bacterium]|nr:hypothetical protein [Anaerolineales bacterium]
MKRLSTLTTIVTITMIISACGTPAAPTVSAADIQGTAQAAAFTMIAQTQEAMPTATPLPPTELPTQTPLPTDTPLAAPTLAVVLSPTTAPASNSGGDPCNRMLSGLKGKETTIRVVNGTKVTITVSMYLNETEGKNECGWRTFNLSKNNDIVFNDLVQGCYNLWAWSDDQKGKFNSSGSGCINNPDKWTFEVTTAVIRFTGP